MIVKSDVGQERKKSVRTRKIPRGFREEPTKRESSAIRPHVQCTSRRIARGEMGVRKEGFRFFGGRDRWKTKFER